MRQTPSSEFDRLYSTLSDEGAVQTLEAIDDRIWEQLKRGEIVEIEGTVRVAGLGKIAELAGMVQGLLPMIEAMGEQQIDDDTRKMIEQIAQLSEAAAPDKVPVVVSLGGTPRFSFGAVLLARHVLVDEETLVGEASVVGKIQRKLQKGEQHLLMEIFGGLEKGLAPKDQRQLARAFDSKELRALGLERPLISHSGALLTPIAIYR